MSRIDYQGAARRRQLESQPITSSNTPGVSAASGCGPKPVSLKQWAYMKRLAERGGTTFTDRDACCSRHASRWIDGRLSLSKDRARQQRLRRVYRK